MFDKVILFGSRLSWVLVVLLLSSISVNAATFGLMEGTRFPEANPPGPFQQSKRYFIEAKVARDKTARAELVLDTPKGMAMTVLGEPNVEIRLEDNTYLSEPLFHGQPLSDITPEDVGRFFDMNGFQPGIYPITLEGIQNSKKAHIVVAQPNSPLILKTQVEPLAVRTNQMFKINALIEDEKPIRFANVRAYLSNGQEIKVIRRSQQEYSVDLKAPTVEGRETLGITIVARGKRFDGSPLLREVMANVIVIEAKSGIKRNKVVTYPDGQIDLELMRASGPFRVDVIYGYQGKSIAWARENITLKDEEARLSIKRPSIAAVADKALVKLLNMDTLGLEDVLELELVSDREAEEEFVMPERIIPKLPKSKQRALEELDL